MRILEALTKGITADRITVAYKSDTIQPYNTPGRVVVSVLLSKYNTQAINLILFLS